MILKDILENDIFLKTIIYIIGIIIFFYYWYVLGSSNAFVGVTIVKGTIMLLNKDLSANPIRNLIIVTIIFICIGFFSYLAALNIYFGIFINFFTIFIITYNFVSNLNQSIWMPFVLGYLYLLVKPVQYDELFIKLIALGVGSLFVIFSQLLLNKRKYKNTIKNNLLKVLELTSNNIKDLISKKENKKKNNFKKFQTIKCIDDITKVIYNRRLSLYIIKEY